MPSYKDIIDQVNKNKYGVPPGWDTAEKVAEEIGCQPHRVRELLADAIKEGLVEAQKVQVWVPGANGGRGAKTIMTVYRKALFNKTIKPSKKSAVKPSAENVPDEIKQKILEVAKRFPKDTPIRILLARSSDLVKKAGYLKADIYRAVLGRDK